MDCARVWATESEASALALFREAGYGRERCQKTQPRESRSQVAAGKRTKNDEEVTVPSGGAAVVVQRPHLVTP